MRHSWLSTSSECVLKSCRGKSQGIQKTLSLIRAASSHNIPGMYSSMLVLDTWLIHVHQICSQCWLLGDVPWQCSPSTPTITYPNFNMRYGILQIESSVFPVFLLGRRTASHCSCPITSSRSVRLYRGAFSTNIRRRIECLLKTAE